MNNELDNVAWLTPAEAQDYLRISKTTLYACMKDGRLPYYYIKRTRQRRIKKQDLDSLMIVGDPDTDFQEDNK